MNTSVPSVSQTADEPAVKLSTDGGEPPLAAVPSTERARLKRRNANDCARRASKGVADMRANLSGAMAGAMAGMVIPIIGPIVGAVIGGALGAGAGWLGGPSMSAKEQST